jgi:hypothetical protein
MLTIEQLRCAIAIASKGLRFHACYAKDSLKGLIGSRLEELNTLQMNQKLNSRLTEKHMIFHF